MAKKRIKVSKAMLFTWCTLAALILFLLPQKITNRFQFTFARLFRLPLSIGRNVSLSARVPQPGKDFVTVREYRQLQNHLTNLTEELRQEQKKVEKLAGIRNRRALQGAKLVFPRVIMASIDGAHSRLMLNRGTSDGLAKNYYVLADNSVIGIITDLDTRKARVKLFTDPTSAIPVRIAGLDVDLLLQGTGGNSAQIKLLPTKHKIQKGDDVLAAEKPGFLDTPMIIGKVDQCKVSDENPLLWDITVKPACDIQKLKNVNVLIMNPRD